MNAQAVALEILKRAGRPRHAKRIADQIMAAGLWQSDGKTPGATVSARLYSDIKNNGYKSPFVKVCPQNRFGLCDRLATQGAINSRLDMCGTPFGWVAGEMWLSGFPVYRWPDVLRQLTVS